MRRVRVAIVDDYPLYREGLRAVAEAHADLIEVVGEASDGYQALTLVRRKRPDVILMDIRMPRLDGIEATRLIKRMAPHVHVIGLSAYEDQHMIAELLEAGADGFLPKSAPSEAIVAAIVAAFRGEGGQGGERVPGDPSSLPEAVTEIACCQNHRGVPSHDADRLPHEGL